MFNFEKLDVWQKAILYKTGPSWTCRSMSLRRDALPRVQLPH